MNELNKTIFEADDYLNDLLRSLSPLYRDGFALGQDVTVPLFVTLHSYSESVLILLQNGAIFEADILLRCTMEGTVRYCYLMTGDEEERKKKHYEYKVMMPEVDRLNDHKKAQDAIRILNRFSNNNTKPFEAMVLSNEESDNLKNKYSKKEISELKKRWAYQSLLKNLASNRMEYEAQLGSLSTYALTSHYCHLDYIGLSDNLNRIMLSKNGGNNISDHAHTLRIVHNVLAFYGFRVLECMRCNNHYPEEVSRKCLEMMQFAEKLNDEINKMLESN